MLILTRQLQETITIGDNVTVTVLAVKGNQVRLGIAAPNDVPVHREEIYERIRHEAAENSTKAPMEGRSQEESREPQGSHKKAPTILTRKRRSW